LPYSQLPDPWHANQNGNFVTNVSFVVLVAAVVPVCRINTRSENVGHPSPESLGIINLKIFKRKLDDLKLSKPLIINYDQNHKESRTIMIIERDVKVDLASSDKVVFVRYKIRVPEIMIERLNDNN